MGAGLATLACPGRLAAEEQGVLQLEGSERVDGRLRRPGEDNSPLRLHDGTVLCGDHHTSESIEGASVPGLGTAGAFSNEEIAPGLV